MEHVIELLVGIVAGFIAGVWYCKPVRDELKQLRAKLTSQTKQAVGKL